MSTYTLILAATWAGVLIGIAVCMSGAVATRLEHVFGLTTPEEVDAALSVEGAGGAECENTPRMERTQ